MDEKKIHIDKIVDEIIEEFNYFDDWEDKYIHIIEMGRNLPHMDDKLKNEETRLKGCQSTVYFYSKLNDDKKIIFLASSDAAIVQGLIALLLRVYNQRTKREILETPTDFIKDIGLNEHLSVTRKNGLSSMINAIKSFAQIA